MVTHDKVKEVQIQKLAAWRARLPGGRPYISTGSALLSDPASSCKSGGARFRKLTGDLRRVADEIVEHHWLRTYSHKPWLTRLIRENVVSFPVPEYRPWREFVTDGHDEENASQELWQRDVGDNMVALALAAFLFESESYSRALREHVLAACRYPTWGASSTATNMDLACAHLARGIAIARDWLPDLWSSEELSEIKAVIQERLGALLRGLYGEAFWHGSWQDNHCQCCLSALGICGLAFLDEIQEAPEWLAAADLGFDLVAVSCHADGSSPEGVPYWSYGISFVLQYVEAARRITGSDRLYSSPYLQNSFMYRLQASTPALGGTLPFGDTIEHDYYGPAHILHALARQYRNPNAQWLAEKIPFRQIGGADCEAWSLLWYDPTIEPEQPHLALDYHMPVWDVAVTRSGWNPGDYLLSVRSGFVNRNHSHLDVGALALAWGDEWLIKTPGYGLVSQGFWDSRERWSFYSVATESHSTLLINNQNQRCDHDARGTIESFETDPEGSLIRLDLAGACYGVRKARRTILHLRNQKILISDEIELAEPGLVEWLLQPGGVVEERKNNLIIRGQRGSLVVRMLWPAQAFASRRPTVSHVNVPSESIQTHSVSQVGSRLHFICEIQPIASDYREG